MKDKKLEDALFYLAEEVANLQSHAGMDKGENGKMSRDDFFSANRDVVMENLCKILGVSFLK